MLLLRQMSLRHQQPYSQMRTMTKNQFVTILSLQSILRLRSNMRLRLILILALNQENRA
jgi:hypothetical protein